MIREGQIGDAASLAVLSTEVWVGTYLRHGISGFFAEYVLETFTAGNLATALRAPDEVFLVSEGRDGIDGFVRLSLTAPAPVADGPSVELATLYVQPRHHGTGIGSALLRAALARCQALGIASLWVATNAENTPAIAFYLAKGFRRIGMKEFRIGAEAYPNEVFAVDVSGA